MEFVEVVRAYLERLRQDHQLHTYRVTRCKLGFRPPQFRDFHIATEFGNMTQMQSAFDNVSSHVDPVESFHHAMNSKVQDVFFALYLPRFPRCKSRPRP
jgi:Family of unknown function (DUF6614)